MFAALPLKPDITLRTRYVHSDLNRQRVEVTRGAIHVSTAYDLRKRQSDTKHRALRNLASLPISFRCGLRQWYRAIAIPSPCRAPWS